MKRSARTGILSRARSAGVFPVCFFSGIPSPENSSTIHAKIQKRIRELAREIRKDFPHEPLLLVGVLKGAVLFLADLARQITGEVTFDFIAVSSYGKDSRSSGQVKLNKDLDSSIEGKTVIVIEDILDTGLTLRYLLRILQQRKPKNLRVAVLRSGPERRAPGGRWRDRRQRVLASRATRAGQARRSRRRISSGP